MMLAVPVTSFDVSRFSGFLQNQISTPSPSVTQAFMAAVDAIQRMPVSTATFLVNFEEGPCVCLELLSQGKNNKLHKTGLFVAYQIRNQVTVPVVIDSIANLPKNVLT